MHANKIVKFLSAVTLFGLAVGLVVAPQQASSKISQDEGASPSTAYLDVPAYHAQAPKGELPTTMNPDLFTDPVVQNAYAAAAKVKSALYQQPCYCHCDRSQGHKSLLDCFASKHGSGCGTCIYEDFYTYEQSAKGKTAAQIRAGIIKGDWKSVDAAKYKQHLPAN
ncbi:MAG TPA: CYCXC family (seleno)protein [Candidatus Acidoferrum sp.]|nr:CYCXC family (seleno)protein [Candidatus Acidoferrum sp.]